MTALILLVGLAHAAPGERAPCAPIDSGAVTVNPCVDGLITLGAGAIGAGAHTMLPARQPGRESPTLRAQWSPAADSWSDWLSPGGIGDGKGLLPIGVSLGAAYALGQAYGEDSRAGLANALVVAQAGTLTFAATDIAKKAFASPRPYTSAAFRERYPDVYSSPDVQDQLKDDAYMSFPSGHASMAASVYFAPATLWMLHELEQDDPKLAGPGVALAGAAGLTAAASALRVSAGKHHAHDVIAGAALGTAIGVGVPVLHWALRKDKPADVDDGPIVDSVSPTGPGGPGVTVNGRF